MTKRVLALVLIAVLVAVLSPAFAGAQRVETQAKLWVVPDTPEPSREFVSFFLSFAWTLLRWWKNEGQARAEGEWKVSLSEYYSEDLKPQGIIVTVVRPDLTPGVTGRIEGYSTLWLVGAVMYAIDAIQTAPPIEEMEERKR